MLPVLVAGEAGKRESDAGRSLVDLPWGARGKIDGGDIMLRMMGGFLVFLWLLGLISHVGGAIHLLLVMALVAFGVDYLTGRRTRATARERRPL